MDSDEDEAMEAARAMVAEDSRGRVVRTSPTLTSYRLAGTHPWRGPINVEGIGDQQRRSLVELFEADGYTITTEVETGVGT